MVRMVNQQTKSIIYCSPFIHSYFLVLYIFLLMYVYRHHKLRDRKSTKVIKLFMGDPLPESCCDDFMTELRFDGIGTVGFGFVCMAARACWTASWRTSEWYRFSLCVYLIKNICKLPCFNLFMFINICQIVIFKQRFLTGQIYSFSFNLSFIMLKCKDIIQTWDFFIYVIVRSVECKHLYYKIFEYLC
jgi:hypothetical protein